MAKSRRSGSITRGRQSADRFDHLVSPLGVDAAQTPQYSPSRAVEDQRPRSVTPHDDSEYQRNERRGG